MKKYDIRNFNQWKLIFLIYSPFDSFFCSLVKHFGDRNGILFVSFVFILFDASSAISILSRGTTCDFSIGFGSGLTNDDRLQVVKLSEAGSFFEPSSLEESTELVASDPLSLELSFSFSLFGVLKSGISLMNFFLR